MSKSTLGRGLNSLIPSKKIRTDLEEEVISAGSGEQIQEIAIDKIEPNPHQPRQNFDRASLEDLINSMKVHGIIQPLVALRTEKGYQLITGERRLRAAKILDLKKVPVVIRSASEQEKLELALVENVQRQNLNPIERAHGYRQLIDEFGLKQEEAGRKVGQSRAAVANTLRLLTLPKVIQKALQEGKITEGHAKVLLSVESEDEREKIFRQILKDSLSVRVTEIQARKVTVRKHKRRVSQDPNILEKEELLQESLGTRVEINKKGHQGTINIHFYSGEELQEIIKKITA